MNQKNEMQLSNSKGNLLAPKSSFEINSNYIVNNIETTNWTLVSDSISQPFTAKISEKNPFKIVIDSEFKEGKKYSLTVAKESVLSYFDKNLKAYRFDFEADKSENFGNITLQLSNIPKEKFWVQLLDSKGSVMYSQFVQKSIVRFDVVKPETYIVRILVDNNENGFWDSSDFANGIFAEDVYNFDKKITARPLWDVVEPWDLLAKKNQPQTTIKPQETPANSEKTETSKE